MYVFELTEINVERLLYFLERVTETFLMGKEGQLTFNRIIGELLIGLLFCPSFISPVNEICGV